MEKTKQDFLLLAANASLEAGRAIMAVYDNKEADFHIELKPDDSPLTVADKESNRIIVPRLSTTGLPVLSEESKIVPYEERQSWQKLWIVDPLDGTKEYIKRNGEFTVNIALVESHTPVMGVIYVPALKELYWGIVGHGAGKIAQCGYDRPFADTGSLLNASTPLPCKRDGRGMVVVASRSHLNDATQQFINDLASRHGDISTVSKGSSLKFCLVAEGNADIYPRFAPTMEWDTAAGQAIAMAAGCKVTLADMSGTLSYNRADLLNPSFIVYNSKLNLGTR